MKNNKQTARGFSLLEVGMALSVTALALAGLNQIGSNASTQLKDQATAARLTQVTLAANSFLQANSAALMANPAITAGGGGTLAIPIGRTTATGAIPADSVQASGLLPNSFVDVNAYGQSHELLVQQPTAGTLVAIVTSYGGQAIKDSDLGSIGTKVGATGGFVMAKPPPSIAANTIAGTFGGWSSAALNWSAGVASPTIGHVMTTLNQTAPITDYLDRYNTGVPDQNRMHTNIDVNNQNLNNVQNTDTVSLGNSRGPGVTVTGAVEVKGQTTADQGVFVATQGVTIQDGSGISWSQFKNGGLYMTDDVWLRTYNNVGLYTANGEILSDTVITSGQFMSSPKYFDKADPTYYIQPSQWSRMQDLTVECNINVAPTLTGYVSSPSSCGNVFANKVYAKSGLYSDDQIRANNDIHSELGNIYTTNGDITTLKGNIFTQGLGSITSANGITNSAGDINNSAGDINNYGTNINSWNGSGIRAVNGGNVSTADLGGGVGYIVTGGKATPTTACPDNGAIAQNNLDGTMLFCTNNIWKSPSNQFGTLESTANYPIGDVNGQNTGSTTILVEASADSIKSQNFELIAYEGPGHLVCNESNFGGKGFGGTGSCTFVVPPGSTYSLQLRGSPSPTFHVNVYR